MAAKRRLWLRPAKYGGVALWRILMDSRKVESITITLAGASRKAKVQT